MTDDELILMLKAQRASSAEFLADMKADPTGFDALGVIRNTQALLDDIDKFVANLEARKA